MRGEPVVALPEREIHERTGEGFIYCEIECECVTQEHGVSPDYSETPPPCGCRFDLAEPRIFVCCVSLDFTASVARGALLES